MQFLGCRVGDTFFYQSGYQEGEIGERLAVNGKRPLVYVKREDLNEPTRTIKVRPVVSALQGSADEGDAVLAGVTCRHLGEAGVEFCHRYQAETGKRRRFASIVNRGEIDGATRRRLSQHGSLVIETDLDSRRVTSSDVIDMVWREICGKAPETVVPVGGVDASGNSYRALARELRSKGVGRGWTVYEPLGGGEMLFNMVLEFGDDMPYFVAATTPDNLYSTERSARTRPTGLGAEFSHLEAAVRDMIRKHEIEVVTPGASEVDEELAYVGRTIPTCREAAVAFAAARRHALEGRFADGQKIAIINSGYDPSTEISWARRHVKGLAAAAALGLLAAGAAPYVNQSVSGVRYAYEKAAKDEDFNMQIIRGQREYLVVSVDDPVEAFAWYNAKIEPLEGRGSLLEPKAREFALIPDHGKAGLVRRYIGISSGKIRAYDNWEFRPNSEAHAEFQEFLKAREHFMKTSAYARIE